MGDRENGWTTVGHRILGHGYQLGTGREWMMQRELTDLEAIAAWDSDAQWPSINKPLFDGPEAKKFDNKLVKLHDLDQGAFGRVDKVMHGSVCLARKRIPRRRGFSIDDLRKEGLMMRKLDHRHVVKLVATYAPRSHELCLLIWPAAVCNLGRLLDDVESLRLKEGDREDIVERLTALDLRDLSAIDPMAKDQYLTPISESCPFDFLRTIIGCVARAMAHCHANNVRHLDIKPSNILLHPGRVYLADFGISRDVTGQEQTTTDGMPGTERWRAPELYGEHGSSMQLSDMYSLGLVYLNIATVLYDARLADFDEALSYSGRLSREEQLRLREDRVKMHLDRLTAHALVRPPFMFTYEGQETVRPRPLTHLISRMVATNPRHRLTAAKVDEKLSMLGGINQIYHADCCKRPISWVEDKWDRKFAGLIALQKENEAQRKRIMELEGKDQTYETRLEKQRQKHEQDISRLQTLLKNAEEKCQRLESEMTDRRKISHSSRGSHGHDVPRPVLSGGRRQPAGSATTQGVGLGLNRSSLTTPKTTVAKPPPQHTPQRSQSISSTPSERLTQKMRTLQSSPAVTQSSDAKSLAGQRSPSISGNLAGYALRSRGSGSKLPLPVTPSRTNTPVFNRDQSMTDSSMASSVFSRKSLETLPTPPAHDSPIIQRADVSSENAQPQWGQLGGRRGPRITDETALRPATPDSPVPPMSPSAMSSPRTLRSDILTDGGDANATSRPPPPSLQPMKSWADVAKSEKKRQATQK
ncbi:protein kinase [Metarhizium robertsii]|uniref:non-specific serine/threonine protein kinase n=2 Tax=Metarhizium robertsii TaxID=568076 RepID=E9ENW2_METRA|nr:Serine/threonine-protein kinase, active site protein [Metarhizium robertsii ARSEF 23]EFZ02389.1 Serine/threonine-protein kinase, active site protein [Metarhizium robertsii ARSEF 23]EXV05576.1 protein kinase [Metarhizium robertsii]